MPTMRFLLVGDGPVRREVEARAASLGLSDRVVFTGNRDDVPELLRGTDVFVLSFVHRQVFSDGVARG